MSKKLSHIPFIETIGDFFSMYGLGKPLHPDIMCMRLEDQTDERLMHVPLYRVNFFRVIHFTNSNLNFFAGDTLLTVSDNCVCFSFPGKLESWTRTGKLSGYVIYFSSSFSGLDITHKGFDADYPFFNFNSEPMLAVDDEMAASLKLDAESMIKEMYTNSPDKLEMIKKMLMVYLHKLKRAYQKQVSNLSYDVKSNKNLYNRFRKELDNYMQQLVLQKQSAMPTVARIAKQLHVNSNYLNSVIKQLTGKTASAHIQEKIVLEAKAFLANTDLQVIAIADQLGFENVPYFNRFFKKNTGLSPSAYRNQFVKT
jgi:AraC-like DNA-binding protein